MVVSRSDAEFLYSIAAELFEGKDIPKWISEHPAIKGRETLEKIFPQVGLENFKEEVNLPKEQMAAGIDAPFVKAALGALRVWCRSFSDRVELTTHAYMKSILREKQYNLPNKEKLEGTVEYAEIHRRLAAETMKEMEGLNLESKKIVEMLHFLSVWIPAAKVDSGPDGRVKLTLSNGLTLNGKNVGVPGESLFRVYGKVKLITDKFLEKIKSGEKMVDLDQIPEVKEFNRQNVPMGNNYQVVFSATGEEGAWDIATMSMRGIRSCQSWDSTSAAEGEGQHRACIIGSIASNYVGVIYLASSSNFEGRGSKMIRRCVVRYGIDRSLVKDKKHPVIILDRMQDSYNPMIAELFLKAIKSRTSIPVVNYMHYGPAGLLMNPESYHNMGNIGLMHEEIPGIYDDEFKSKIESLPEYHGFKSYRDTPFQYLEKDELSQEDLEEEKYMAVLKEKETIKSNKRIINKIGEELNTIFVNSFEKNTDKTDSQKEKIIHTFNLELNDLIYNITIDKEVMNKSENFVKKKLLNRGLGMQFRFWDYNPGDLEPNTKKAIREAMKEVISNIEKRLEGL